MPIAISREAADDAQYRQRPIPTSKVPRPHCIPASAVRPSTQGCWKDVGDIQENRAHCRDR